MIQLMKYRKGEPWDGFFVWVKHDHITFLSVGIFTGNRGSKTEYTSVTTIGGGQVMVRETPMQIMAQMPGRVNGNV